jgi:hypothetical protein
MIKRVISIGLSMAAGLLATAAMAGPAPKVTICHIPPGNPSNFQTITVATTALAAHYAHGDIGGSCNDSCAQLCDDHNACTDDSKNCSNGCKHEPVDCNDGQKCTSDSCNPERGCINTPVQCEAPDACTNSTCAPDTGECVDSPVTCPSGYECDLESGECVQPGSPCDGVTCPAGETCIPTADPLCQPEACSADWTCGGAHPSCGSSGPLQLCLCDVTVEGDPFCWEDISCVNSPLCSNSSECPTGWKCVTSCCETSCIPPCNGGFQNARVQSLTTQTAGPSASGQ